MSKFELTKRNTPNSILIDLNPPSAQISKHFFSAKMAPTSRYYPELDQFKQLIELTKNTNHHQPYTANKHRILIYKAIFFGIAAIFTTLGILIFTKIGGWSLNFSPTSMFAIKGILCSICAIFAAGALSMTLALRTEREAVLYYAHKAQFLVKEIYIRKRAGRGIKKLLGLGRENGELKILYQENRKKIEDLKTDTLLLTNRISDAESLSKEKKETLFNQAISEMNEKLTLLVHTFQYDL